jgi:hypothetical protein
MNNTRATVATAAVVSFTVIVLANLNDKPGRPGGLPQVNQLIGYAVVFTILSIFADFNLEFAGGLSLVAMLAILFGPQFGSDSQLSPIEDALQFLGQRGGF